MLAIFPRDGSRDNGNVIRFPGGGQSDQYAKTTGATTALHDEQSPLIEQTEDRARPRGIEGLLRQLFEEIATDD